eukprot:scaffold2848_cov218-Pinguiococcus_pyrenoidosus.AAC.2
MNDSKALRNEPFGVARETAAGHSNFPPYQTQRRRGRLGGSKHRALGALRGLPDACRRASAKHMPSALYLKSWSHLLVLDTE